MLKYCQVSATPDLRTGREQYFALPAQLLPGGGLKREVVNEEKTSPNGLLTCLAEFPYSEVVVASSGDLPVGCGVDPQCMLTIPFFLIRRHHHNTIPLHKFDKKITPHVRTVACLDLMLLFIAHAIEKCYSSPSFPIPATEPSSCQLPAKHFHLCFTPIVKRCK
jgi:hypothetical protein